MKRIRRWLPALLVVIGVVILAWPREEAPSGPVAAEEPSAPPGARPSPMTAAGEAPPGPELTAREAPPPPESRAPVHGPVRVRVVGPGGAPVPGVFVRPTSQQGTATRTHRSVATDEHGEALFADFPYDGSVTLGFYRRDPESRRRGPSRSDRLKPWGGRHHGLTRLVVTGPELRYRAETGLPMTVRVVAADTGGDVAGALLSSRHGRRGDARTGAPAPRTFLVTPHIGLLCSLGWYVRPPDGWVAWDRFSVTTTVSPYAEALEAVYPLRRELNVTVQPREAEGGPARAEVDDVQVAGRGPREWSGVEGDGGLLHVEGVPFLHDEILELRLCRPDRRCPVRVRTVLPDRPTAPVELAVVMPKKGEREETSINEAIGIGGRSRSTSFFRSRGGRDHANAIVITVRRRNGEPAVGAEIQCGRRKRQHTNLEGRTRFERLAPGEHRLRVHAAGLLPMARTVTVPAKGEVEVELHEGVGGELDVLVVDDEHRPLSFATVAVKTPSGLPWIDMIDERVQRIDPFTDVVGRRRLTHLEPGTVEITASWASREETVTVEVQEGEASSVLVVLPRPAPPR